jgi:hypothetical protein
MDQIAIRTPAIAKSTIVMRTIIVEMNKMEKPTPDQWARWYAHKSNKERFVEAQEALEEE